MPHTMAKVVRMMSIEIRGCMRVSPSAFGTHAARGTAVPPNIEYVFRAA